LRFRIFCAESNQTDMEIYKEFQFEAAHYLPNLPEDHKCRRMHGHSYRIKLYIGGPIDPEIGWIKDFADIKKSFTPVYKQLDHYVLNDIEGLENPTSENLARWIWNKTKPLLPELTRVEVMETCTTGCIYEGDDS